MIAEIKYLLGENSNMPIYDYLCPNCHTKQELLSKAPDTIQNCPKCQTEMVRQLSSPCFILKGVGVSGPGSFRKSKDGPYLDPELLSMPEKEFNVEMGTPGLYE
jgi:putative FmdB family regulatory protein